MFTYVWLSLKRRWPIFLVIVTMLSSVSLGYGSTRILQESIVLQTREDLEEHWRWQYDLLVYPKEAQSELRGLDGWIAPQTPLASYGGISFADLETIRQIPGVEVAAPISLLGYFDYPEADAEYKSPEPGAIYHLHQSSRAYDGLKWQPIYNFQRFIEVYTPDVLQKLRGDSKTRYIDESIYENTFLKNKQEEYRTDEGEIIKTTTNLLHFFRYPNQLLFVAVDPEAEEELYALSNSVIEGEGLLFAEVENYYATNFGETIILPIVVLHNQGLNVEESLSFSKVDIPSKITELDLKTGFIPYLLTQSRTPIAELTLYPYQPDWRYKRFSLLFDEQGYEERISLLGIGYHNLYWFSPITFSHHGTNEQGIPRLQALGEKGETTHHYIHGEISPRYTYRELIKAFEFTGINPDEISLRFGTEIIGYYDANLLVPQYASAWQPGDPIDLYTPHHSMILADGAGNPVDPRPQVPLPFKDAYYTGGPEALTLLTPEVAELFYGEEPPISSIRVVVEGVEERSELSQKKIEQVALEIMEKTGHQVEIMLGSAPSKVHIELASKKPGEIGLVEESWNQRGVSWSIEEQVVNTNRWLFLYLLIIIFFLTYTIITHSLLKRASEFARLRAIGWSRWKIIGGLTMEVIALTFFSLLPLLFLSSWGLDFLLEGGTFGIKALFPESFTLKDMGIVGGLNGLMITIGYFSGSRRALWLSPRAGLAGESGDGGAKRVLPIRGLFSFVWHQLFRRPLRFGLLVITVMLSTWMVILFVATQQSLTNFLFLSFLGEVINLHLQTYQRAFLGIGLSITLGVVLLLLLLNIMERQKEFFIMRAIGWPWKRIRHYLYLEAGIIGGLGGVLGTLFAYGILTFFSTLWLPSWVALLAIFVPMLLMVLATWLILSFYGNWGTKEGGRQGE